MRLRALVPALVAFPLPSQRRPGAAQAAAPHQHTHSHSTQALKLGVLTANFARLSHGSLQRSSSPHPQLDDRPHSNAHVNSLGTEAHPIRAI